MTEEQDWRGKRVSVIGLGIEGEDLARYFALHGARVTVGDRKPAAALQGRVAALRGLAVDFRLGEEDLSALADADLVCVSQSVPLDNAAVVAARARGVPLASMTGLFLDLYPGPVLGITGSSGKTTTTSLVDAIFGAAGRWHVLGGNIGVGLMSLLEAARPERWAVLEVSHTQLQLTQRSPHVGALLNVTPNHLDQFSWEEYVALKRNIFAYQSPNDAVVFNADDPVCHTAASVTAAAAIAAACDIGPEAVASAVRAFQPPAHRLELVGRAGGVDYYHDSIATAPERTLAALRAFEEPVVLLLGGR